MQKKGLVISWSEDDSKSDTETAKQITDLAKFYKDESDCEEPTFEELATSYKKLCLISEQVC